MMDKPEERKALVSHTLKEYRKNHHVTQEELAEDLSIDPERLGLAASISIPKTPEQIEEVITHVWSLVEEARLQEARTIIERLVENLHIQITANSPEHLLSLAHAYHTAGYVVSEATRAHESYEALFY